MLQLIKSHPWTCAIGALIFLVAVAGVVVGVWTKGRWKDRGLMERGGVKLRWAHAALPLPVLLAKELEAEWMERAFTFVRALNVKLGFPLFMLPAVAAEEVAAAGWLKGAVVCVPGDEGASGASTEHHFDLRTGFIYEVRVQLPRHPEAGTADPIFAHELLHAVGLDHDDQPTGSVLAPTLNPAGVLTAADLALLRSTYRG